MKLLCSSHEKSEDQRDHGLKYVDIQSLHTHTQKKNASTLLISGLLLLHYILEEIFSGEVSH